MAKWVLRGFGVLVFSAIAWATLAGAWGAHGFLSISSEAFLYLLGLPLTALTAWFAGIHFLRKSVRETPGDAGMAGASLNDTSPDTAAEKALPPPKFALVGAALRVPHSNSASLFIRAHSENVARPELDPELQDGAGFPALTGRVQDLGEDELELHAELLASQVGATLAWRSEQIRAAALATGVVEQLAHLATSHPQLEGYLAASTEKQAAIALPTLYLIPVLPSSWDVPFREALTRSLLQAASRSGWPRTKAVVYQNAGIAEQGTLALLERFVADAERAHSPWLGVLVSCDSHLGEQTIMDWEGANKLYSAHNQHGLIPGEGAAGLLLASPPQAALLATEESTVLSLVKRSRRAKPASSSRRVSADDLSALVKGTLETGGVAPSEVGFLVGDADARPTRASELMEMTNLVLPHLDMKEQCLALSAICGELGAATEAAVLVLAHHLAVSNGSAALCVSNKDDRELSAALVRPITSLAEDAAHA